MQRKIASFYVELDGELKEVKSVIDNNLRTDVWVAVRCCEKTGRTWLDAHTARFFVTDTYTAVKARRTKDPIYDNENPVQRLVRASLKINV